ncbi:hypothetical protein A3Q56_05475 [Intoshia linei]|uniref:Uncharacterized protein n=1 Tax=Intoshia linei TaxID=1819745 RepID=A0A177B057_9BILA|nr:hypothetical protein A3Q56_05475 [Intoshia linei]
MCNSNLKPCLSRRLEKHQNDENRFIENFRIKRARYDQKSKCRYRWEDKLSHDMIKNRNVDIDGKINCHTI